MAVYWKHLNRFNGMQTKKINEMKIVLCTRVVKTIFKILLINYKLHTIKNKTSNDLFSLGEAQGFDF